MESILCSLRRAIFIIIISINTIFVYANSLDSEQIEEEQVEFDEQFVTVIGKPVVIRNRVNTIEPTLSYDVEFFQRFEPSNLQDMLKRIPGITVESLIQFDTYNEVTEPRGVSFRGFSNGGQILINGRKIPGITLSNALSLTNFPVDIIKEIQVIRAATASIDNEGIGLTLNIVLKDASSIPQGEHSTYRVGYRTSDGEPGFDLSLTRFGDLSESLKYLINATYSDQKTLTSGVEQLIDDTSDDFRADRTIQSNIHNGKKQSAFNSSVTYTFDDASQISLKGYYINSDNAGSNFRDIVETVGISSPPSGVWQWANESEVSKSGIFLDYNHSFADVNELTAGLYYLNSESSGSELVRLLSDETLNRNVGSLELAGLPFIPDDSSETSRKNVGVYSQVNWQFIQGQKIIAGLEFEKTKDRSIYNVFQVILFIDENGDDYNDDEPNQVQIAESGIINTANQLLEESDELTLYLEYIANLTESLSINLGNRYERRDSDVIGLSQHFDANNFGIIGNLVNGSFSINTPSAHLKWNFSEEQVMRLSWVRSADIPDLNETSSFDLFYNYDFGRNEFTLGNPGLEAGIVDTINLSYDYHFYDGLGVLGFAMYSSKESNIIYQRAFARGNLDVQRFIDNNSLREQLGSSARPNQIQIINGYINSNITRNRQGIEFDINMPLHFIEGLNISSNVSYVETDFGQDYSALGLPVLDTTSLNFSLDHQIGLWGYGVSYSYRSTDTDFIGGFLYGTTSDVNPRLRDQTTIFENKIDRDPSVDIFIERRFSDELLVRLSVENITDARTITTQRETRIDEVGGQAFYNYRDVEEAGPQVLLNVRGSF